MCRRPKWPEGPEMIEESEVSNRPKPTPKPPPKRIISPDVKVDWDKFRTRIAWMIFVVLAIPIACFLIIGCIFGIGALGLVFIPAMIAPKQEMRFGHKTISLRKGDWLK